MEKFQTEWTQYKDSWLRAGKESCDEADSRWGQLKQQLSGFVYSAKVADTKLQSLLSELVDSGQQVLEDNCRAEAERQLNECCGQLSESCENLTDRGSEGADDWKKGLGKLTDNLKQITELLKKVEPALKLVQKLT